MAVTALQYLQMLKTLLPRGDAWRRDSGSTLHKMLDALSQELSRIDIRSWTLMDELDPNTTNELLSDWERIVGIPDGSFTNVGTPVTTRRAQIVTKLTLLGGPSASVYIAIAALLGITATITEFRPFLAGASHAGDPDCGVDWAFAWQVNAPTATAKYFAAGQNAAGDPLGTWGNTAMQALISKLKPAHTYVLFSYS